MDPATNQPSRITETWRLDSFLPHICMNKSQNSSLLPRVSKKKKSSLLPQNFNLIKQFCALNFSQEMVFSRSFQIPIRDEMLLLFSDLLLSPCLYNNYSSLYSSLLHLGWSISHLKLHVLLSTLCKVSVLSSGTVVDKQSVPLHAMIYSQGFLPLIWFWEFFVRIPLPNVCMRSSLL